MCMIVYVCVYVYVQMCVYLLCMSICICVHQYVLNIIIEFVYYCVIVPSVVIYPTFKLSFIYIDMYVNVRICIFMYMWACMYINKMYIEINKIICQNVNKHCIPEQLTNDVKLQNQSAAQADR